MSSSWRLLFRYVMREFQLQSNNHFCWGTNIEYDFGNILKDFDCDENLLDVRWRKGRLTKFELLYEPDYQEWGDCEDGDPVKGRLKVWDTLNHWPMGVADMGKTLTDILGYDFNKLPKDFYALKYSAMDAIVSRSYAAMQKTKYDTKEISLKLTPGATALNWYIKGNARSGEKFCKQLVYNTHTDTELKWLIKGLRGGRTEVFSLKAYSGKIGYFDINSAYPYSMKHPHFPFLKKHAWLKGDPIIRRHIKEGYEGMVLCDVDATNLVDFPAHIPYLGTTDKATFRFVFPLGRWQDRYTFFEIRRAELLGYRFKLIEAIVYPRSHHQPFEAYVTEAYALREEGAKTGDRVLRDIGKSLGNNLYGKWAQRLVFAELESKENYEAKDIANCKRLGSAVIVEKDDGFARHSNVIWGAYITAICRNLLYDHMMRAWANGNEVLYCDTDSIFITGGEPPESDPVKIGALKHEADLSHFQAFLPKTYLYEEIRGTETVRTYKAKGVPKDQRERFIVEGNVEYRKPMKIREALARKNFNPKDASKKLTAGVSSINAWVTVTKELRGEYTKRKAAKDGSTTPLWLGEK